MTQERLTQQADFITARLEKSKQFNKYGLTLVDSNEVIIGSLMGELRNMILSFFKGGLFSSKKCEHCGSTTASQYERAHNKGESRSDVALRALKRIRPLGEKGPVLQKDFMKAFIEEHKTVPLWILCKACHKVYDSADTADMVHA
jgi:hypothetical protein